MNLIEKRADRFIRVHIRPGISDYKKVLSRVQDELYDLRDGPDKIIFISVILKANDDCYQEHLEICKDPEKCQINYSHESIQYALEDQLNQLGVNVDEDTFTMAEQVATESKLDGILAELEKLKMGQEILYNHIDEVKGELTELKELYVYGKKKWLQLFLGKTTEMVISGIISETVSKKLIQIMSDIYPKLLN